MTDAEPPLISSRLAVMLQEQGGVNERLACERGPSARGTGAGNPWLPSIQAVAAALVVRAMVRLAAAW